MKKAIFWDNPVADYEGGLEAGMTPILVHNVQDGKEKAEAIEVFALEMLRDNKESAKEFFCKKNGNPFPTLESLRSLYIEYGGNEYELWHDYGDAYIKACKKFNVSKQDKEKWNREV